MTTEWKNAAVFLRKDALRCERQYRVFFWLLTFCALLLAGTSISLLYRGFRWASLLTTFLIGYQLCLAWHAHLRCAKWHLFRFHAERILAADFKFAYHVAELNRVLEELK